MLVGAPILGDKYYRTRNNIAYYELASWRTLSPLLSAVSCVSPLQLYPIRYASPPTHI